MCMPNNYAQQVQGNVKSSIGGLAGELIKDKKKPIKDKPPETKPKVDTNEST